MFPTLTAVLSCMHSPHTLHDHTHALNANILRQPPTPAALVSLAVGSLGDLCAPQLLLNITSTANNSTSSTAADIATSFSSTLLLCLLLEELLCMGTDLCQTTCLDEL